MAVTRPAEALSPDLTPVLVWGRAAVLGAVIAATGTASHLLGAGHLPGPFAMSVLLVATVALVACFLRVRASNARLVLLVVGGQTLVHTALSVMAGHRGDAAQLIAATPAPVVSPSERSGRFFDHYEALSAATPAQPGGQDWLAHQIDHFTAQAPMMVAAHVLGAVAVALFLGVGERALWRILLLTQARARVRMCLWLLVLSCQDTRLGIARAARLLTFPVVIIRGPALLDRRVRHHRGPPFVLAA